MKKILILLLFTQISFAQINFNNCEIRPELKNKKDFVKEIVEGLKVEKTVAISFYVSKEGDFFAALISEKEYYYKLQRILEELGTWTPGENDGKKVVVRIQFNIKILKEDNE